MSNIMINKVCNLKCSYCFANEFVNKNCKEDRNTMSIETFRKALNFVVNSGETYVGIIGGEPTLHPNLKEILEIIIDEPRIEGATLFTNGIDIDKYFDILHNPKIKLLINMNSPKEMGKVKFDKMIKNIDYMINKLYMNYKISIGINMYKPDFDYEYMIQALKKFKLNKVRTSIAVPNDIEKRNIDAIQHFTDMKPRVFEFFKELEKIDVMPVYDCNLMPFCVTTDEEKKWLENFWKFESVTGVRCNITDNPQCDPVLDILPDLTAVRCFGCSEQCKANIDNFCNTKDLSGYFKNEIDIYSHMIPASEKCVDCYYKNTQQCSGGCYAFKQRRIENLKKSIGGVQ